jgi:hypothetical protein
VSNHHRGWIGLIAGSFAVVACASDLSDPLDPVTYDRHSCSPVSDVVPYTNFGVARLYRISAAPHLLQLGLDTLLNVRMLVIGRGEPSGRTVHIRSIFVIFDSTGKLTMAMESSTDADLRDSTVNSRATPLAAADRERLRPLASALARKCFR